MFISMKPQLNKDFIRASLLKIVSQCHGMGIQRAEIPSLALFFGSPGTLYEFFRRIRIGSENRRYHESCHMIL